MIDGDVHMTESSGMAKYLVDRYGPTPIAVDVDDPEYGAYLNWLFYSDATLTFPQTLVLRYTRLEPEERRQFRTVASDYRKWYLARRLRLVETGDLGRTMSSSAADRFTIADICVGYGLKLAASLGIDDFGDNVRRYWTGLQEVPSYQRIREV